MTSNPDFKGTILFTGKLSLNSGCPATNTGRNMFLSSSTSKNCLCLENNRLEFVLILLRPNLIGAV